MAHPAAHPRQRTGWQLSRLRRACQHASRAQRDHCISLNKGATEFLASATPTVGDLVEHSQDRHAQYLCPSCRSNLSASSVAIARANLAAQESVHQECTEMASKGPYGCIITSKPDNTIWIMYENFSSLSLFAVGPMRHTKIHQLNKLMSDYVVDFFAECETCTDWRFINEEDNKYCNLFGNGLPTRGVCASNINDGKVERNQWGYLYIGSRLNICVCHRGRTQLYWFGVLVVDVCWRRWQIDPCHFGMSALQPKKEYNQRENSVGPAYPVF
jgi:hypothetical protein